MDFKVVKKAVQDRFYEIAKDAKNLFVVDVDGDVLWEKYLSSFPEGSNPIHVERTVHDCTACRHFIKRFGNVVAITGQGIQTMWDVDLGPDEPEYQVVVDTLASVVKDCAVIKDVFKSQFKKVGVDFDRDVDEAGQVFRWDHFFVELDRRFVEKESVRRNKFVGETRATKEVFQRSVEEITDDAVDTVIELIQQNSLYRGEEFLPAVMEFRQFKEAVKAFGSDELRREWYYWVTAASEGPRIRIRGTSIGTLLVDLSEGTEIDVAVRKFEKVVAPTNYRRPKPIMTKAMIEQARAKIKELGFEESLARRCAVMDDITVNNVLFANRSARKAMSDPLDALDELEESIPVDTRKMDRVEEISIEAFIQDVMPSATALEVLVEGQHCANLVSLVAPLNSDAPSMFNWRNGFSWAYAGEVADSIKERVKSAGGDVEGVLRWSLSWFNRDDLDLHVIEPNRNHIFFKNKGQRHTSSGMLDVDMNYTTIVKDPVENITWTDENRMQEGVYEVAVNNFTRRDSCDVGFEVEMEYKGTVHRFVYNKPVQSGETVRVARFSYTRSGGIVFLDALDGTAMSKDVWGIKTNQFQNVSMVMFSPNHWDGAGIGNRHYFFMLEGCQNPDPVRGFFNEFMRADLIPHRKVFEALGSKMKAQPVAGALCGVGFSSTRRNSILCKVHGSFTRVIRLKF